MNNYSERIAELVEEIRLQLEEEQKAEIMGVLGDKVKTMEELSLDLLDLSQPFSMKFTVLLLQALSDDVR